MCIFVASTNGKIVLPLGFKEKNVGSQDLLILQQILVLLWKEIVLEARALRYSNYIIGARKCCKIKDTSIDAYLILCFLNYNIYQVLDLYQKK